LRQEGEKGENQKKRKEKEKTRAIGCQWGTAQYGPITAYVTTPLGTLKEKNTNVCTRKETEGEKVSEEKQEGLKGGKCILLQVGDAETVATVGK